MSGFVLSRDEIDVSNYKGFPIITKYDALSCKYLPANLKNGIIKKCKFEPIILDFNCETITTSLNFIFGEDLYKKEVYSFEGTKNSCKTRICCKLLYDLYGLYNVLYFDTDYNLSDSILFSILKSLGCNLNDKTIIPHYSIDEKVDSTGSLHIINCNKSHDVMELLNLYTAHTKPDVIIIDSMLSLFYDIINQDAYMFSYIGEFAIELKRFCIDNNCCAIITNSIKAHQTYLGKQYGSLWHNRIVLKQLDFYTIKSTLVSSPRKPPVIKFFYTESLLGKDVEDVDELMEEQVSV